MLFRRTALLFLAGAVLTDARSETTRKRTTRSTRAKSSPPRDNGEQPQDRERRLARECRHLANAGACAGYGYGS